MTFDDLTKVALVGTAHAPAVTDEPLDASLADALATVRMGQPEDDLLAAAAVLSAYETCGRLPDAASSTPVEPAAEDVRPACSRRAANVLGQLLAMPNTPSKQRLIQEWLAAAACANRRVPYAQLPALLDYGVMTRDLRDAIAAAVDQRGAWLMAQNERWRFAAAETQDAAEVWAVGNREQRASALRRMRSTDPAAGRALVASTWKEDAADERTAFIEAFAVGLGPEDELSLEAALDDRSKQVRAAAAEVLGRLPTSALVTRMTARIGHLLAIKRGRVDVALPPEPLDPAAVRDGVTDKPLPGTGKRQWWLSQMLAFVPPSHWSNAWQLSPAACVAAAKGEYQGLLLNAWTQAADRFRDTDWAEALLLNMPKDFRAPYHFVLLSHLPPERRRHVLTAVIDATTGTPTLTQLLNLIDAPLAESLGLAAVAAVERVTATTAKSYSWAFGEMLTPLALCLPPSMADALAKRWTGPDWDANRKAIDGLLTTLQLRQTIHTEFSQ